MYFGISPKTTLVLSLTSIDSRPKHTFPDARVSAARFHGRPLCLFLARVGIQKLQPRAHGCFFVRGSRSLGLKAESGNEDPPVWAQRKLVWSILV